MFEGEAYRSYIQLCRELRLERHVVTGDWYASWEPGAPSEVTIACQPKDKPTFDVPSDDFEWQEVWLPSLAQWLTMLEEAGVQSIRCMWHGRVAPSDRVRIEATRIDSVMDAVTWDCYGPTREEACARLYLSVTGRTVTSG